MDQEVQALGRTLLDKSAEPTTLKFALLHHITDCFSDERRIGHGSFSVVYKGIVGREMVAVKKLTKTLEEKTFHKEIECLVKAKHKNIVRFLGCCAETQAQIAHHEGKFVMADTRVWLLCFEYVPNGSLDKYIADASCGLEWTKRYKIIKGICDGLCYLHDNHILHSDLKPANILIDDHMVPRIADFGLSRCLDEEQTGAFTRLPCGTLGYLAPELFREQFAFAPDIYSVGVIIGEILTGEKDCVKVETVIESWKNRLEGDMELEQVRVCTKIGIECMESDLRKWPTARHIVDRLQTSIVETRITSSLFDQPVNVY